MNQEDDIEARRTLGMTGGFDDQDDQDQYALTLEVLQRIGVSIEEVWVHYLSMGGDVDEYEVNAYFHGLMPLPAIERDLLSKSVNELLDDITRGPRAPFSAGRPSADVRANEPCSGAVPWMIEGSGLLSIVYSSVATQVFSESDLLELLRLSRHTNGTSNLTGLLLYREGHFLQVLEGPEQSVRHRMISIIADSRHTAVRILVDEKRQQRQFPKWTMRFEPLSDTLLDEVPRLERACADAGQDTDPDGTVRVTRELVQWFQQKS